jgi:hypothetical protein
MCQDDLTQALHQNLAVSSMSACAVSVLFLFCFSLYSHLIHATFIRSFYCPVSWYDSSALPGSFYCLATSSPLLFALSLVLLLLVFLVNCHHVSCYFMQPACRVHVDPRFNKLFTVGKPKTKVGHERISVPLSEWYLLIRRSKL